MVGKPKRAPPLKPQLKRPSGGPSKSPPRLLLLWFQLSLWWFKSFAPYSGALFISISSISRICTTSAAIKRCAYSSSAIDLSLTMSIKSR
jgi:hypothetical protein